MLKNIWNWLVTSSQDPTKLALTVKAGIPFIVALAAYFKFSLNQENLASIVDQLCIILSALVTVYGLARKIKTDPSFGLK